MLATIALVVGFGLGWLQGSGTMTVQAVYAWGKKLFTKTPPKV